MNVAEFQKVPLFSGLSEKEAANLLTTAKEREFAEGDEIIHVGDERARAFYLLLEGSVRVSKGGVTLADLGPGDYFGEMALLLEDTPRTADVTATSPTRTLAITQWDFRALLTTHPRIGVTLMAELARRLGTTNAALSD